MSGEGPLHVAFAIDHLGSGGAQRQVAELASHLHARGDVRCSVLVYHGDDFYAARLSEAGVPVTRVPKRARLDPLLPRRIARWLGEERPDVLHAFLLGPALWSVLAVRGLPGRDRPALAVAERNSRIAESPLQGWLQRRVYRAADAVTANARCAAQAIVEQLGVPAERVHYLPNGIDLARWDAAAREPGLADREPARFHWALVGGLRPQKGHAVLLEALSRLGGETKDWRVWCVGGRTAGERAAESVASDLRERGLADVVRLLPPVRNVAAFLRGMDALVLPSLFEGFPNVVLEAMASRLPVVATPVGDVPGLVIPGETGFLAPPGDAEALAAALRRLARLPEAERRALGERGRARVEEHYALGPVADGYRSLYEGLRRPRRAVR